MTTVHLILNAHLDPVWLWPWHNGLDALIATCRSACDRLDRHPEVHFCKGEAWGYRQIERVAPQLFQRIREHVAAGRWHIVGGWWIQPDCNGPSGFALRRQIALGKQYFLDRFNCFPRAGYNVDTFGHTAALPAIMHAAGQDCYVFMRPQEHEMALPARVFRWRGHEGGPELVCFRIARTYAIRELNEQHFLNALSDLPPGIEHTLCFIGLGDHGGGPTERQLAWIAEHRDRIPGCRLEFSWPERFFDAIWPQRANLPLVTGELQMHAVGCYTVHRPVKVGVRRAEHALACAATALAHDPAPPADAAARLQTAWEHVCFNHFHDTFGGTCIPGAYDAMHTQLGAALDTADELLQFGHRRRLERLPDDAQQRIVLFNPGRTDFDGYVEHEAWFEHVPFDPTATLVDDEGHGVQFQRLHPEALVRHDANWFVRLLFRTRVPAGATRVLRLLPPTNTTPPTCAPEVTIRSDELATALGLAVRPRVGELRFSGLPTLALPRLDLIEDLTDTWSHDTDRYGETAVESPRWNAPTVLDHGPLMGAVEQTGHIGQSELRAEWRVYANEPYAELLLTVHWCARHRILKLTWPTPLPIAARQDGIPADIDAERAGPADLVRAPDGRETPARDRTLLHLATGATLGLVFPDAYALDARPDRVRLTLLRSPLMAHHDPYPAPGVRGRFADQGVHTFRFRFFANTTAAELDRHALLLHRPLLTADLTRGMPAR